MHRWGALILAAGLALNGCGNSRTPTPDISTPGPPIGTYEAKYPKQGIEFKAPAGWLLRQGTGTLVASVETGGASVSIWRYPRTEPLPRTRAQLEQAQQALVAAAQARDPTFKQVKVSVTRVAGAHAIVIRGTETIEGNPRTVRSAHVYSHGAEVVVDALASARYFRAIDALFFRPLLRSLRVGKASQA